MDKKKLLIPAVTTREAFDSCLQQKLCLFCVENPLYFNLFCSSATIPDVPEYEIETYPDQQIALYKRISGENRFDPQRFEIEYLPLTWDNWQS